jgi:ABC-type polysaccharide/polyol phosphate transport system ATPase subunit
MTIRAEGLTVDLPIYNVTARSLRREVFDLAVGGKLMRKGKDQVMVRALTNVNFDVGNGERVGVVGHNGAGKTTLLRVVAGVYAPTKGRVAIDGSVSALFGAGIGLDPEATGIENIRLLGAFHGLTKKGTDAITPDIVDFCELGAFIDLPVKTYSAGMITRLSFAVATSFEPDVLVLDEWLGAGDASFVNKAQARVESFVSRARVVLLASHSDTIISRFCTRVLWLEHSKVKFFGPTEEWAPMYAEYVAEQQAVAA